LQITEPRPPVVEPKGLKKWLRGFGKGDTLRPADLKALGSSNSPMRDL